MIAAELVHGRDIRPSCSGVNDPDLPTGKATTVEGRPLPISTALSRGMDDSPSFVVPLMTPLEHGPASDRNFSSMCFRADDGFGEYVCYLILGGGELRSRRTRVVGHMYRMRCRQVGFALASV